MSQGYRRSSKIARLQSPESQLNIPGTGEIEGIFIIIAFYRVNMLQLEVD